MCVLELAILIADWSTQLQQVSVSTAIGLLSTNYDEVSCGAFFPVSVFTSHKRGVESEWLKSVVISTTTFL